MSAHDSKGEKARKIFCGPCEFVAGVAQMTQLPGTGLAELAFVGRSNVGKSSLINALTGRKALARTSHTPGRTQQLNFFDLGGRFYIVDMPGYGFAKVSKKQRAQWDALIFEYLRSRPVIRCVFVLVDARHGLKDGDRHVMTMLDEAAVAYRIVLTKADKAKNIELLTGDIEDELKNHTAAFTDVMITSAHKQRGLDTLREVMYELSL